MPIIVNPTDLYSNSNSNTIDWGVTLRRFKRQPIDESSTHSSYKMLVDEMARTLSPLYKGQIVSVTGDDDKYFGQNPDKISYGHAPYYIDNNSDSPNSYFANRLLTMSYFNFIEGAYYVNRYQLGTYYTGVGFWPGATIDATTGTVTFNTYAEVFNDYATNIAAGTYSHVEGSNNQTTTSATYSHVGGQGNISNAPYNFTTGTGNINNGASSIVFGSTIKNNAETSIVGGSNNINDGTSSVVTGANNNNTGDYSQIAGIGNTNNGDKSNVIGEGNTNNGDNNYVNGVKNVVPENSNSSVISGEENTLNASSTKDIVGGSNNYIYGDNSIISGSGNTSKGTATIIAGNTNTITSDETKANIVSGTLNTVNTGTDNTLVMGKSNITDADNTVLSGESNSEVHGSNHIIGGTVNKTTTGTSNNTINGNNNTISGSNNTVTGTKNTSSDSNSFIGGSSNKSTGGTNNIIVGTGDKNTGNNSAVGGSGNTNNGNNSVVFGKTNSNDSNDSLVIGSNNTVNKYDNKTPDGSIVFGDHNNVTNSNSLVGGEYSNTGTNTIFAMGIGTADERKNAIDVIHETNYGDNNNATTYLNGNGFTYTWLLEIDEDGNPTGNTYGEPSLIINQAYMAAYGVNKWQLGTEYTGVGKWWYDEANSAYTNQLGTYGEIFNDYTYNRASGSYSHAEGKATYALGYASSASNYYTIAQGTASTAIGAYTKSSGVGSTAEGTYSTAVGMASHAEGDTTYAGGISSHSEGTYTYIDKNAHYSHVEGKLSHSYGVASHAEGYNTYIGHDGDVTNGLNSDQYGLGAHAEGIDTSTYARGTHVEGYKSIARSQFAHAEGNTTYANSQSSHAEGNKTWSSGTASHAEGDGTYTFGNAAHAEGYQTRAQGNYSHTEGLQTASVIFDENGNILQTAHYSHVEGDKNKVGGDAAHAEGGSTIARGNYSHTEGFYTFTSTSASYGHTEGRLTSAYAESAHAEGTYTFVHATYGHSEGYNTHVGSNASGSHAEGLNTFVLGEASHVEGSSNSTYADSSHAEGKSNVTSGESSHIEGTFNKINEDGYASHVEGNNNEVSGQISHAEGGDNVTDANYSHVEGRSNTIISGIDSEEYYPAYSHAEGWNNLVQARSSHIEGQSNTIDYRASYSHVEGQYNSAWSLASHVEGNSNVIWKTSEYSHVEGTQGASYSKYSHVEGVANQTYGKGSHSEGYKTVTGLNATYAHAEGRQTYAAAEGSHVEGGMTQAYGSYSHAGGYRTYTAGDYSFAHGTGNHTYNDSEFTVGKWNRSYTPEEDRFYRSKYTHEYDKVTGTYTSNGVWPEMPNADAGGTLFTIGDGTGDTKQEQSNNDTLTYRHNILQVNADGSMLKNGSSYFNNDIFGPVSYTYVESLGISAYLTTILSALLENPKYYPPVLGMQMNGVDNKSYYTVSKIQTVEFGSQLNPIITFRVAYVAPQISDYDPIYHNWLGNRLGYSEGVTEIKYKRHIGSVHGLLNSSDIPTSVELMTYTPSNVASLTGINNIGDTYTCNKCWGLTYHSLKKSTVDDLGIFSGAEYTIKNGKQVLTYATTTISADTVSTYWAYKDSMPQLLPKIQFGKEERYTIAQTVSYNFKGSSQMYFQQLANKMTYVTNNGLDPTIKFNDTTYNYPVATQISWYVNPRFKYYWGFTNTQPTAAWTKTEFTSTSVNKSPGSNWITMATKDDTYMSKTVLDHKHTVGSKDTANGSKTFFWVAIPSDGILSEYKQHKPTGNIVKVNEWYNNDTNTNNYLNCAYVINRFENFHKEESFNSNYVSDATIESNMINVPCICRLTQCDASERGNVSTAFIGIQNSSGKSALDGSPNDVNTGTKIYKVTTTNNIGTYGIKYDIYYIHGWTGSIADGAITFAFRRLRSKNELY